jgi:hypothetical protein
MILYKLFPSTRLLGYYLVIIVSAESSPDTN